MIPLVFFGLFGGFCLLGAAPYGFGRNYIA
jgi:hypothetical protein